MNTSIILSARSLVRTAAGGKTVLLHDIDLDVFAGSRIAVSGASGSGKSVLLRALSLLDFPDKGKILYRDRPVALHAGALVHHRSRIAYIRQQPELVPGSVRDNLALPFTLQQYRDRSFDEASAQSALEAASKEADFLDRDSHLLSGGEAQIVCLLRVLQLNPEVLLLDEPTAALDPASAEAVQQLIAGKQKDRPDTAYIWVSHSEEQVREVGDTVWHMDQGRLTGPGIETAEDAS